MRGYLFYERADANINHRFIEQLQIEAQQQNIDLLLVFPDELETLGTNIHFVWNRSRQAAVAHYFEARNIRVFNNARTNELANNKLLATRFVENLRIQAVPTWENKADINEYPIVIKSLDGHGGKEVLLCHTEAELTKALQQFEQKPVLFQPYIESNAQDVRVWMLGTTVLGAVLRSGTTDFKSNYTLGGSIEKFELPEALQQAVHTISKCLPSDYIGIDFLKATDGTFYFNELEDPVGAKSYYDLYDDQLAKRLVHYIKNTIPS